MNPASISVVIPLCNNENSIVNAIESIQRQTVKVNEIIVVDDGSTDASVERVNAMQLPNLKLIHQAGLGLAAARNRGIAESTSTYVAFLDANDKWMPFFTLEMQSMITRFPDIELLASRYQFMETDGTPVDAKIRLGSYFKDAWLMHDFFAAASKGDFPFVVSSCVAKRSLFDEVGTFPVGEAIGEEPAFFAKAALAGAIAYSPNVLVHHERNNVERVFAHELPKSVLTSCDELINSLHSSPIARIVAADIEQYFAALLLGVVKQKLAARNFQHAQAILAHPLCKQKVLVSALLKLAAYAGRFVQISTGSAISNPKEKLL